MKLQGILGKGTGKLGNAVFAVSGGEQIMREYNPNVSNPNTEAQVAQRAKLKLMSQLAASLSSVIAIPKQGLVSSRNLFIKENIGNAIFVEGEAKIDYLKLQLTKSSVAMPTFNVSLNMDTGKLTLDFGQSISGIADRVVIIGASVNNEEPLMVNGSVVADVADAASTIEADSSSVPGTLFYVYGIKDKSGAASAKFDNYEIVSAESVAKLVAGRSLTTADVAFTTTASAEL